MNESLTRFRDKFIKACEQHGIGCTIANDEYDSFSVVLHKAYKDAVDELLESFADDLSNIEHSLEKLRGGYALVFSTKALAEYDRTGNAMKFMERLNNVFANVVASPTKEIPSKPITNESLLLSAYAVVQNSRPNKIESLKLESNDASPKLTRQTPIRFESKVAQVFDVKHKIARGDFNKSLNEALDGLATADGSQPSDLFNKFANSLALLGQQIGIGPLQDQLKQRGINWKKADDGQSIILYIINGSTNAQQPVARISAETLNKPSDFETQLLNILDFSRGEAPGTFKLKQQEAQAQEKAVREIAKSMGPQDPNSVSQQLNGAQSSMAPSSGAGPTSLAPAAAAQQAAIPKV